MANHLVPHQRSQVPGRVRAVSSRPLDEPNKNEIGTLFEALRNHWWLVLASGALALFAGWWGQRNELPEYTAEVLLQHSQDTEMAIFGLGAQSGTDFGTRLEIIRSRAVMGRVVDSLGLQIRPERPELRTDVIQAVEVQPDAATGSYRLRSTGSGVVLESRLPGDGTGPGPTPAGSSRDPASGCRWIRPPYPPRATALPSECGSERTPSRRSRPGPGWSRGRDGPDSHSVHGQ